MTFRLPILLSLLLSHLPGAAGDRLLTDAEADAIIEAREAAKARQKAEHLANTFDFTILERREARAKGRRVIANRIADPGLPERAAPARSRSGSEPAAGRLAEMGALAELQPVTLAVSATVYERDITRLRWRHEGKTYEAWSEIDWNLMRSVVDLRTDTKSYLVLLAVGNASNREPGLASPYDPAEIPDLPPFSQPWSEYALMLEAGDPEPDPEALKGIDALHAHFDAHEAALRVRYHNRKVLAGARERYDAAHPEEPKDVEVFFWKPDAAD